MLEALKKDPFRLFFLVGWLFSIAGAFFWVAFKYNAINYYPVESHGQLMIGGFLVCFIMGFLMTAVPRFTETNYVTGFELSLSTSIVGVLIWSGTVSNSEIFYDSVLGSLLFMIFYSGRRFLRRKSSPPDTFIFVGAALLMGVMGTFLIIEGGLVLFGKALFFQGMVLGLILGVGGRLVPGILGWVEIVLAQRNRYENQESFLKAVPLENYLGVALFVMSFFAEFFLSPELGRVMRALVVLYIALRYWRLPFLPPKKTVHTFLLWLSCWSVLIGTLAYCLYPSLNTLHLVYIGGFGLITMMVATRVTLAHGDLGLSLESKVFPLGVVGFCILLAGVTRASVSVVPDSYVEHLNYSALTWILGMLVWGLVFIPKMFQVK
ncbi:MAG: NnrS family protein [Bdellovibrionales bacterium]